LRLCIPVIVCAYGPRLRGGGIAGALVGAAAATTLVRQLENRRQPAARPAAQLEPAPVASCEPVDDREAEAGALVAAPRRIEAIERPQQRAERVLGHPGALVFDDELDAASGPPGRHGDLRHGFS